jgi:hypothetical protein
MCGPSSQEESLQQSSQNFSSILQNNYTTQFGKQQHVLDAINRSLSPTLAAGPNQRGFDSATRAALDTQAINAAGAANRNAQQAARTYGAGEGGGGTSGITSGITKQIEAAIGSQSAEALAQRQGQIQQADFSQGNQNYWRAQGGMDALAAGYNPNASASGAISENQASFGQANKINEENNAMAKDIAGFTTSLAGTGMKFLSGGINASPGQSFLSGGLGALG